MEYIERQYEGYKEELKTRLNLTAKNFFMIGYFLRRIAKERLYEKDGYKDIWEFSKAEYGLSVSSTSRFMNINARFSLKDNEQEMDQKYIGMGVSKLQEMLTLTDEQLETITPETTVKEIREIKKAANEPLSFYGLPRTVRPKDSLLTTKGCGNGKYDCFSCSRNCQIRQEPRQCRVSSCGNPKPCQQIDRKDLEHSLYNKQCMFLHQELAPTRAGDGEPTPCCLLCEVKECSFIICDVAKQKKQEERKAAEKERQQKQREAEKAAEALKLDPTKNELEKLYDVLTVPNYGKITAQDLRKANGSRGGTRVGFTYDCSGKGVRINNRKEQTWAQIAKAFTQIRDEREDALFDEDDPNIIDADFVEIKEEPREAKQPEERIEEEAPEGTEYEVTIETEEKSYDLTFTKWDVQNLLESEKKELDEYLAVQGLPEFLVKQKAIMVAALNLLFEKDEEEEIEE